VSLQRTHHMKFDAANHLKLQPTFFKQENGFNKDVRVTAINIFQEGKWVNLRCEGDLAALLAHDANANVCGLDHGHVIGTVPNAQHLAAQAPLLALQPPLDALGPTLSLLHLHHTHAQMLPPSIGSFIQEFIHEVCVFLTVGCVQCPEQLPVCGMR